MADTLPTLRIDWDGSTGLAQTGADVSARLLGLEWWRGRDFASQLVGKSNAGSLIATLNNNSGDYSPDNTSSPLTGNLAPDTSQKVRLNLRGRAAQFTAANSEYLNGGDVLDRVTLDYSIPFWIYPDSVGQYGIVNKRDRASATNVGYAVELQSDGTLDLLHSDGGSVITISSTTALTAGTWNLCIVTADRNGNAQWYINNGAAEGATDISSQTGNLANGIDFQIGAGLSTSVDRYFNGRLASVAVYNKLLTSTERTFLWRDGDGTRWIDGGLTGDGSTIHASDSGWFDLQEESGNRADSSGNANTLTDTNTVTANEGIPNFTMWSGFLKSLNPLPSISGLNTARLVATGPLGAVNLNKLRLAMGNANESCGLAIGRILDEANWSTDDRSVNTGKTQMTRFWLENEVRAINAMRRVEATEGGFLGESKDGRVFFEERHKRQKLNLTSEGTFTDANGGALPYSPPVRRLNDQQQLFHVFTVPIQTWAVGSLAILWTLSASGPNSPAISPGEALIFWAEYPNPASPVDAIGIDAWTTPEENTDYEANSEAGGGGNDMSGDLSLTITKFGNSMKIAITNDHATDTAFLTLLQGRGTPLTKEDPARVTVEVSATNPRTYPNPPPHLPSISEAFDWCNWNAKVFGVSQSLLEMTLIGSRSEALMKQVLGRDLSDRITFVGTNDAGLGINEDFYIESMRFHMDPRKKIIRTMWAISSVASTDAWTLGTSKLGTETRVAY